MAFWAREVDAVSWIYVLDDALVGRGSPVLLGTEAPGICGAPHP